MFRSVRLARLTDTAPVSRGLFVRQTVLCQTVPPPPADVNAVPPPPDGQHTHRERLALHRADLRCAGCHEQLDPPGLAFETFDAAGAPRTTEAGRPVDPSGVLTGVTATDARFADATGLGRLLGTVPEAQACFTGRLFGHANGLGTISADRACVVDRLAAAFAASGGDVKALAAAIASDETFWKRRRGAP